MAALSSIVGKTEVQIHKNAVAYQDNVLFLNLVGRLCSLYIRSVSIGMMVWFYGDLAACPEIQHETHCSS